jgi:hypothetical protein
MRITIAKDLAHKAGIPHARSQVDVLAGSGPDAGKLRVQPGTSFTCTLRNAASVFILLPAPPGAPGKLDTVRLDAEVEDGGIVFALPWHVKPADRVVEELPKTLDAIEESARPIARMVASLLDDDDPPVNGTAINHVYADSEETGGSPFTHNGKTTLVNRKQHLLLTKLQAPLLKPLVPPGWFIDYATLIKATGVPDKAGLQTLVSKTKPRAAEAGLTIKPMTGLGYCMDEV